MFRKFFNYEDDPTPVDEQIAAVMEEMTKKGVDSEEYPKLLSHLAKLHEMKMNQRRNPVSWDTIAMIAGNCLIASGIVLYETKHLTNSKGWNQLTKLR